MTDSNRRTTRAKPTNKRLKPQKQSKRALVGEQQPLSRRLAGYFKHHQSSALEALQRLIRVPAQTLPTCLVIAIALALPAMLYLGLANMDRQADKWQAPVQLSVFLHKQVNGVAIEVLGKKLDAHSAIAGWHLITPEQAIVDFQAASGFADVLANLDENPLPSAMVITPVELTVAELEQLSNELNQEAIVDTVLLDLEWVARLQQIVALIERVVTALACLLAVGVVLIVGNVIRLAIANRKDEIVISKLVGASNGFVRRPFLYTGLWYGLLGGLLALVMLLVAQLWLAEPIAKLAALYGSQFELAGLGLGGSMGLVLAAGVLGSLGAWLSVTRHLSAIKPS